MPVLLTSETDHHDCSLERLEQTAETLLALCNREGCELSLLLVDDPRMTELNRDYRGKNKPTNVLSFPMLDEENDNDVPQLIGDIVISLDTARREAEAAGMPLDDYLLILLVHGFTHLLGFDHERGEDEAARMQEREKEFLDQLAASSGLRPLGLQTKTPQREG